MRFFKTLKKEKLISVVVVIYNMKREAPRTIMSLSSDYQKVSEDAYEVIVVENGSSIPFTDLQISQLPNNFRYFFLHDASSSPAYAVNFGVQQARGSLVCVMVDGARILSPGILASAIKVKKAYINPIISTLAWHIGPDIQTRSVTNGYNALEEDELLRKIRWPENGYKLFEISTLALSSKDGWFMPISESNCLFLLRKTYKRLGGFDERFDSPGGGLVNLDFYKRACELPDSELCILLGEGTFHQIHGGVATNTAEEDLSKILPKWTAQYRRIRQCNFKKPTKKPVYFGGISSECIETMLVSTIAFKERNQKPSYDASFET